VICLIIHWLARPNFASWDKSGAVVPPLPSIAWQAIQLVETKRRLPPEYPPSESCGARLHRALSD